MNISNLSDRIFKIIFSSNILASSALKLWHSGLEKQMRIADYKKLEKKFIFVFVIFLITLKFYDWETSSIFLKPVV